jgi:hypothetical protein
MAKGLCVLYDDPKSLAIGTVAVRRRDTGDAGMLVREPPHPRRIPDRIERKTRGNRSTLLRR